MSGNKYLRIALLLLLVSTAPVTAVGQEEANLDVETLATLHAAGVPASELEKLLDTHGIPSTDPPGLERLRKLGVAAPIIARIEAASKTKVPLTVDDVVTLSATGLSADEIIAEIRQSNSRFDLQMNDMVRLARSRVPADVIKEMRERGRITAEIERKIARVTVDDVVDLTKAGFASQEIVRRIRTTKSQFDVDVDGLLELRRNGVAGDVLKEIWSRKPSSQVHGPQDGPPAPDPKAVSNPTAPEKYRGPELITHREPGGGFSINVPAEFKVYRETRNANSLVSFTNRGVTSDGDMPDAELQILRYRSRKPEWLVEANLEAIGSRFLTMLQTNYVKKGLTLTHNSGQATHASGQPARIYNVGTSARDGTAHEGRLLVTWLDDQVFVLSYAVRADLLKGQGKTLNTCLRSFTLERSRELEASTGRDEIANLFDVWMQAVTRRDFALYRQLVGNEGDTTGNRAAFVALAERLTVPDLRLSMGTVDRNDPALPTVQCKVTGPDSSETISLAFEQGRTGYRLRL